MRLSPEDLRKIVTVSTPELDKHFKSVTKWASATKFAGQIKSTPLWNGWMFASLFYELAAKHYGWAIWFASFLTFFTFMPWIIEKLAERRLRKFLNGLGEEGTNSTGPG